MVIEASKGRIPELIPIRYGRMQVSPFTFFRGSANIMAADLATTAVTGLTAQLCGDCHLLNFNGYATPERHLIFDLNDFDETLPGPWEWDVKRLATSFILASRSNGFSPSDQRDAALACVRSYREHMAEYAAMGALDVWYARLEASTALASFDDKVTQARLRKRLQKARHHIHQDDFPKMVEVSRGHFVIKENPPLIYHHAHINLAATRDNIGQAFARYRKTLADDRKTLLDRYVPMDLSLKVVGIGSVGTFCAVMLMMASDDDPLFLQVKEARPSVLEPYAGKSVYANHGERVVVGQRLMQSASDIFLGWGEGLVGHFYVRQLRDMKFKPSLEYLIPSTMVDYANLCGWTLARAHARSGDPAKIAGYLGKRDVFDRSVTRFGEIYADLAERDHASFTRAIRKGRIQANLAG